MNLDELRAELSLLLSEMDNRPEDSRELYCAIHRRFKEVRALGVPMPDDLKRMERNLLQEFSAESLGR